MHADLTRYTWLPIAAAVATILLKAMAWWLTVLAKYREQVLDFHALRSAAPAQPFIQRFHSHVTTHLEPMQIDATLEQPEES